MKVNIAVCGRFHYHNYVKYIEQYKILNRFIYSHKLSTNSSCLSVPEEKLVNIWLKEYLVRGHIKVLNNRGADLIFPLYHDIWQFLAIRRWSKCDIFHTMLHGNTTKLIQRAKEEGSIVVGEPVNTHPHFSYTILNEEYANLGIKKTLNLPRQEHRLIREIDLCDRLIAPSSFVAKSFLEKGFSQEKIHIIPYGVNLANFYPLLPDEKECRSVFRVICVAQISPRKGHIYLLEAWKKLQLPNSELILIGNISQEMMPILSKYQGIFKHIQFVPNVNLRQYYGQSDVFILPSLEDGFAYVCAEAMACGLPVITTTNTGASELIEHGREGFIVPIRLPEAIANYLESLYRNEELRLEMSSAALRKAQSDLSWEYHSLQVCDLYDYLMGNK